MGKGESISLFVLLCVVNPIGAIVKLIYCVNHNNDFIVDDETEKEEGIAHLTDGIL